MSFYIAKRVFIYNLVLYIGDETGRDTKQNEAFWVAEYSHQSMEMQHYCEFNSGWWKTMKNVRLIPLSQHWESDSSSSANARRTSWCICYELNWLISCEDNRRNGSMVAFQESSASKLELLRRESFTKSTKTWFIAESMYRWQWHGSDLCAPWFWRCCCGVKMPPPGYSAQQCTAWASASWRLPQRFETWNLAAGFHVC